MKLSEAYRCIYEVQFNKQILRDAQKRNVYVDDYSLDKYRHDRVIR